MIGVAVGSTVAVGSVVFVTEGKDASVGFAVFVGLADCVSAIAVLTELPDGSVEHAASVTTIKIKMHEKRFIIPLIFTSNLCGLLVFNLPLIILYPQAIRSPNPAFIV